MSFRFTPGCCCQSKCPTCKDLIDSGTELPYVSWSPIDVLIEKVKKQRGLSCQYGYLDLYRVEQDGWICGSPVGSSMTPRQFTTYFDESTGFTTLKDGNIRSSGLQDFIESAENAGYKIFGGWRKCQRPHVRQNSKFAVCEIDVQIVNDSGFVPTSATYRPTTHNTKSVDRKEDESVEDWITRAINEAGASGLTVSFNITLTAKVLLTIMPQTHDIDGIILHQQFYVKYGPVATGAYYSPYAKYDGSWVADGGSGYEKVDPNTLCTERLYFFNLEDSITTGLNYNPYGYIRSFEDLVSFYNWKVSAKLRFLGDMSPSTSGSDSVLYEY